MNLYTNSMIIDRYNIYMNNMGYVGGIKDTKTKNIRAMAIKKEKMGHMMPSSARYNNRSQWRLIECQR